jgi:hypothetical protein
LARNPLEGTASLEDQIRIAQVFATDTILTTLMCATRSVYSWDIIITRTADALYLDKRDPEVRPWPQYRSVSAVPRRALAAPLRHSEQTVVAWLPRQINHDG